MIYSLLSYMLFKWSEKEKKCKPLNAERQPREALVHFVPPHFCLSVCLSAKFNSPVTFDISVEGGVCTFRVSLTCAISSRMLHPWGLTIRSFFPLSNLDTSRWYGHVRMWSAHSSLHEFYAPVHSQYNNNNNNHNDDDDDDAGDNDYYYNSR